MSDLTVLYQQMGEVLRGLRALAETIDIRDSQTQKLHDLVRADLATLRQDQRDLEEKLDCVVCVVQHDLSSLRVGAAEHAQTVGELVQAVQSLRVPVNEIMTLRSRAAGLILGVGLLGSAILWLAEPFYEWVIDRNLAKH
jgi:hypothetical protein